MCFLQNGPLTSIRLGNINKTEYAFFVAQAAVSRHTNEVHKKLTTDVPEEISGAVPAFAASVAARFSSVRPSSLAAYSAENQPKCCRIRFG